MSLIGPVNGKTPNIHPTAFVAWGAVVLGEVELGPHVNLWYGCVLRGDINWIKVGARTNIQDGTVIHVGHKGAGTQVGADVVIGHRVVLHSCVIEDQALIGMGAVVLDHAQVGKGAVVGAGSVVAPGQEIPPGVLALGVPAKVKRALTADELARPLRVVSRYLRMAACHQDPALSYDFSQEA
ncbi:MAG: gamma carbonic anhydrase family protein [Desulfarculus sp.]|nr:gamma carbonic anhydrase family protein [Desulfarculus sp.]